ncbi:alpha/beta hydrolase [Porphyrobacter sp. CACIAM 03H1]|uniref:alpha/beta hydrolase n=1 Tax=Porphyrobacter sp. CACIAM 03H1 TaxID=2003315 RepID=UPI000B5A6EF3|nr:alpha/beta hydrolase [Porphyrobacter sp. CACIAM 03H1]ASJ90680.1 esterase [Porphyrobacter sp. CACIAM 03H1]
MRPAAQALIAAAALAVLASPILAQQRRGEERLPASCRQEVVRLCGINRGQIAACLREKYAELSEGCQAELRQRIEARGGREGARRGGAAMASSPALAPQQTLAYGSDPLQALDLWVPEGRPAPLVLFVHGGGWSRGSKSNAVGRVLPGHLLAQGYAFASIDYRLVPAARVEDQAADVAAALAHLLARADALGIDRTRVVLTGHSAGAHLVALVGTDETYLRAAGLSLADIDGVMPNDGAAYDVAQQLALAGPQMRGTYEQAFGSDPARHKALSPIAHAAAPNAPAFLLLHVQRPDAAAQSKALAEALRKAGAEAEVSGFPGEGLRGHMEINRNLGQPDYPATPVMDAWLKKVLGGQAKFTKLTL